MEHGEKAREMTGATNRPPRLAIPANDGDHPVAASSVMTDLAAGIGEDRLSVGVFLDRLDTRAPGLLLLILALPMCVPNVPGISTLFGLLLIAPALQMMFGRSTPWLPRPVRAWSFSGRALTAALRVSVPLLRRAERFTRPRLNWMMRWYAS